MLSAGLGTIIWTSIAFITVVILLKQLAWKPILSTLREREEFIDKSLKSAEEAKAEMSRLKSDNEKLLAEARVERDKILKEAREMRDKMINEAKKTASEEGDKMIAQAKSEIEKEKTAAMHELRAQVAELSLNIAEKVLRKEFEDKNKHQALVEDYLKGVQSN
jgi:F-type H+-transporting ATPase subunit b